MRPLRPHRTGGFTLAELITVIAILGILSTMAVPIARFGIRRNKEIELRARIRRITDAIDDYHRMAVAKQLNVTEDLIGSGDYPKDLEILMKGVKLPDGKKKKFLRERDLIDPMTGEKKWFTRSSTDDFDSTSSDDANVFDVHSTSTQLSLDGKTKYSEW